MLCLHLVVGIWSLQPLSGNRVKLPNVLTPAIVDLNFSVLIIPLINLTVVIFPTSAEASSVAPRRTRRHPLRLWESWQAPRGRKRSSPLGCSCRDAWLPLGSS